MDFGLSAGILAAGPEQQAYSLGSSPAKLTHYPARRYPRLSRLRSATPAEAAAPTTMPTMFAWTQVRQALQQTAAIGACSPYFAVAWLARSVAICFTPSV